MKHPVDAHVGKRIRHRRWMVGMTQQQLADKVGINPGILVTVLFNQGEMVTATQSVSDETLILPVRQVTSIVARSPW